MSYGASAALQAAVYQHLTNDVSLGALVGGAIYDALPGGTLPATYVTLGPEEARDRSDGSGPGTWHTITISVVTDTASFHAAKEVASAVSDALHQAQLSLSRGQLVDLSFHRARAKLEGSGDTRRIDLSFRARVDDTL